MRDQIDFSRLERIKPRKFIDFIQTRTKYVLAASFIAVAFITAFVAINRMDSEAILVQSIASDELVSWYNDLGETSDDELENLDTYSSISYLLEETK